jgi:hypothetical protein
MVANTPCGKGATSIQDLPEQLSVEDSASRDCDRWGTGNRLPEKKLPAARSRDTVLWLEVTYSLMKMSFVEDVGILGVSDDSKVEKNPLLSVGLYSVKL